MTYISLFQKHLEEKKDKGDKKISDTVLEMSEESVFEVSELSRDDDDDDFIKK